LGAALRGFCGTHEGADKFPFHLRGDRFHVDPQGFSGSGHTWRSAVVVEKGWKTKNKK
jgi:hypothetical protein